MCQLYHILIDFYLCYKIIMYIIVVFRVCPKKYVLTKYLFLSALRLGRIPAEIIRLLDSNIMK